MASSVVQEQWCDTKLRISPPKMKQFYWNLAGMLHPTKSTGWYTVWCCYGNMLGSSPFLFKIKYYHSHNRWRHQWQICIILLFFERPFRLAYFWNHMAYFSSHVHFNGVSKRGYDLTTISNGLVLLPTCVRNLKPPRVNKSYILDVLVCSIAVYFHSFVFWLAIRARQNTAQLAKIYRDTAHFKTSNKSFLIQLL